MTDQPDLPAQSPEEDFTSDLIGVSEYQFDEPKKKTFLPWHRPRKQFVREKQWAEQIAALVTENVPETGLIKYLGLPGDDLLDLRHFHDTICASKYLKIRFLGFNRGIKPGAAHKAQLEVSLDEVKRLPNIDQMSELISDDLTSIAINNSVAWQKSSKMGPYDVINIDLCDGFAKHSLNDFKETHYNTLHRLMSLQARRPGPWLLLLTTRSDSDGVADDVFTRLKGVYLENLAGCDGFLAASGECFSVNDETELTEYCNSSAGFSNIFMTSLCKWVLKIGLEQNPPSKVEIKNVFGYKVAREAASPDLMSIAIKVIPTFGTAPDPIGLANQVHEVIDECALASRILKRVNSQKDVDAILAGNHALMDEMLKATSDLLEQARYDISNYNAWAKGA